MHLKQWFDQIRSKTSFSVSTEIQSLRVQLTKWYIPFMYNHATSLALETSTPSC